MVMSRSRPVRDLVVLYATALSRSRWVGSPAWWAACPTLIVRVYIVCCTAPPQWTHVQFLLLTTYMVRDLDFWAAYLTLICAVRSCFLGGETLCYFPRPIVSFSVGRIRFGANARIITRPMSVQTVKLSVLFLQYLVRSPTDDYLLSWLS
jgi:hypothetical protein